MASGSKASPLLPVTPLRGFARRGGRPWMTRLRFLDHPRSPEPVVRVGATNSLNRCTLYFGGNMRQRKQRFLVAICALFIATLLTTSSAVAEGGCWGCIPYCPFSEWEGDVRCEDACNMEEAEWECVWTTLCGDGWGAAILCTEEPE